MIIYDAGALVAAERNVRPLWALHDAALRRDVSPLVSAGVLAQVWRGGPQASLSRLLTGCTVTPLDESLARAGRQHPGCERERGLPPSNFPRRP